MIIVTGGAGFIGSNIVKGLNDLGEDRIIVVDNLKNAEKVKNLSSLKIYDYVDKEYFVNNLESFKGVKVIFHQGACTNTMEEDGRYVMNNNYEYSKRLLNFCMDSGIRFIYASSASVYGDGKRGFREERECERPLNVYAYSKFLFDEYVRRVMESSPVQIVGLRYFNVYGPGEGHKGRMASVVYQFYNQIKREGKIRLFEGSDNFKRDFIYVKDVVKVNLFFYEREKISGIFNCGTGRARSFLDVAEIMREICGNVEIEFIPFPEELKGKYQTYTCADLERLKEAGYKDKFTSLEEGIRDYIGRLREEERDLF